MRIIFIIIAIVGILFIVRQMLASRQPGTKGPVQNTPSTLDALTECHHCGLHLPSDDAIHQGDDSFCCVEHLNAHKHHD